jgi:ATP-binding cassette subfamily C protein/ATP-binding cassette subfamily C exporter for protease/lipase/ATP-binding cassette subfamily C protein EexD
MPLPKAQGSLALERAAYSARDGRAILRAASFSVAAGEFVGMVGPSGAGKSTLCRLIVGALQPTAGTIRLDGADIAAQSRAAIGPQIGYLPQNPSLFAGTVAENIARMAIRPDAAVVIEAAKAAGVHELVLQLPKGYDTLLGDEGAPLSAGQRQRIGLARALFGQPCLVILDEPNAHLDAAGEAALVGALQRLKELKSTVLLVTHRLNILRHADRILVVENGGVERFGARDAVLAELMRPARVA